MHYSGLGGNRCYHQKLGRLAGDRTDRSVGDNSAQIAGKLVRSGHSAGSAGKKPGLVGMEWIEQFAGSVHVVADRTGHFGSDTTRCFASTPDHFAGDRTAAKNSAHVVAGKTDHSADWHKSGCLAAVKNYAHLAGLQSFAGYIAGKSPVEKGSDHFAAHNFAD